jgi:hypothetical protein
MFFHNFKHDLKLLFHAFRKLDSRVERLEASHPVIESNFQILDKDRISNKEQFNSLITEIKELREMVNAMKKE